MSRRPVAATVERALRVAIIGAPNAGKSLLTNRLIRADVAAVSRRMDTTRQNQQAVLTEQLCQVPLQYSDYRNIALQLVLVDSPGTIGTRHARKVIGATPDAHILTDPESAMASADRVLVVHDASQT